MPIDERVKTPFIWAARVALYPLLLLLRVAARSALLVATALPIMVPALALIALFQRFPGADFVHPLADFVLPLVEQYQILQALAFLIGGGLFAGILMAMARYAWDKFMSLVKLAREVLLGSWYPGWEILKGLEITWHDNIAQIPGHLKQAFTSAGRLTITLVVGVSLAVAVYPVIELEPKTVDRYVAVVGVGDTSREVEVVKEEVKVYMRAGTVFSLAHLNNAQPKSGDGICLDESQRKWLGAFRAAITECVELENESGLSGESSPTLEVEAFASIEPVRLDGRIDKDASATLNCEIANRRADAVGAFLAYGDDEGYANKWRCPDVGGDFQAASNLCGSVEGEPLVYGEGGAFTVHVTQWLDSGQMQGSKPANDGALPDERRFRVEMFNRSVHIRVPEDFCRVRNSEDG